MRKAPAFVCTSGRAVENYPLIATLVIPGDQVSEARIKVKTPGNLLYVNYHKLADRRKKEE